MPDIEAPISSVTVFTDRAQITRRARVPLTDGAQELTIAGLPAGLDENSLRAGGSGATAVKILGVENHNRPLEKASHLEARTVQSELDDVLTEGAALKKRSELLERREKTVRELADNAAKRFAYGIANGLTSLESAGQLLDFVDEQTRQINEQRLALRSDERANAEKQMMLQRRLEQFKNSRNLSEHCVTVALESAGGGEFDLEINYTVRGANWMPLYDARVQLTPPSTPNGVLEGTLELTYMAKITQQTGEDWNDVTLTLSTAQPSLGTLPPKLEPVYIDIPRPVMPPMMAAPAAGRAIKKASFARAADVPDLMEMDEDMAPPQAPPVAAIHETAKVESSGATVTFELPRRYSVPTDGQAHRGTIAHYEFPVRLDYQAVPRRAALAYLRATVTNTSGLSLLAGQANVFRDGAFTGAAALEAIAPGQEFKLFLGPDEQVRAKRELVRREVDKNFMGNVRRQNYGFKIEVENLKPHRVELTLLDQVPVSRHEQIKVKPRFNDPEPETDDLGLLTWKLNLPANTKRELHSDYVVECPRDMTIAGLTD